MTDYLEGLFRTEGPEEEFIPGEMALPRVDGIQAERAAAPVLTGVEPETLRPRLEAPEGVLPGVKLSGDILSEPPRREMGVRPAESQSREGEGLERRLRRDSRRYDRGFFLW